MTTVLEVKELGLDFGKFQLGPIHMEINSGEVMGLIGSNGAGKTTLLKCLTGLLRPDCGNMSVFGQEVVPANASWKQELGFVSDTPAFYENWNGRRNLCFLARYYPTWSEEIVENVSKRLKMDLSTKVKYLSKGNRAKLALIAGLAHRPKLLILDEPSAHFDPVIRSEVMACLFEFGVDSERSILFSTHQIHDLEKMVDRVAFMQDGRLLAVDNTDRIVEPWRRVSFRFPFEKVNVPGIYSQKVSGEQHVVVTRDLPLLKQSLEKQGVAIRTENRLTLEEVAVEILKGEQHDLAD